MIIPSISILAVSAITYTILHETHEQVVFREGSRGSQTTGIIPDISITTVHVAPDTIHSTIPKTTRNVPLITEVTFPLSTALREFDVSSATATSLAALWGSTSSPSLLRRGQDLSSRSSSTGGTGAIPTASETAVSQTSSFTSSSFSSSNTSPSTTSSPRQASSSSITETSQSTSSNPVPPSDSLQRPSTSETSDSGASSTATTASHTSSERSETSSMASASSLDLSSPTSLTRTLASDSSSSAPSSSGSKSSFSSSPATSSASISDSSSSTNAPESTSILSDSSSSSSSTSTSSQVTDVPKSTSGRAGSSGSSASSFSSHPSSFSFSSVFSSISLSTFSTFLTPFSRTFPTSFPSWTSSDSSKIDISSTTFSVPTKSPSSFSTATTTGTSISFTATGTSFSINPGSSSTVATETSSFLTTVSSSPSSSSRPSSALTSPFTSPSVSSTISSPSYSFPSSSATSTHSASSVTSRSGSPTTLTSVIVVPSGSLNDGASGKESLPKGAIAAIVTVTVLAIAAVALWLFFACRRRRRRDMHRKLHYSLGGVRSSADGESGLRTAGTGLGLGASTVYALGRDGSNISGMPIRTSPLQGEDADLEVPHSSSAHSGASGDPNSFEGGLMREASASPGTGFGILPNWMSDPARTHADGFSAERLRGGDAGRDTEGIIPDGPGIKGLEQGWLGVAGVGPSVSTLRAPLQPRSSLSFAPVPINSPKKTSFTIAPYTPILRERSVSPQPYSPVRTSLLPTRSEASESALVPGPSKDSRRFTVVRTSSGSAYLSRDPPPSAWSVTDNSKDKGRAKEGGPSALPPANESGSGTFDRVRSRSSMELSSSGHGNGYGSLAVTSSQGHGSATASGETEYSSGSASTGSHQDSATSQRQRKRRSNSDGGGFFARTASLARTDLRSRLRRASMSGVVSDDNSTEHLVRPPSPVSRLVTSMSSALAPTFGTVFPPSPISSLPPSRVSSTLMRSQSPGPIRLPPIAPSAMMRASGPSMRLPAIVATPSPVSTPTPDGAPDGLLDPQLAVRLREIHGGQASFSTLGLRDHEDYSRPIHALVNNRNSSTTVNSDYSRGSEPEHTPTQPEMRV